MELQYSSSVYIFMLVEEIIIDHVPHVWFVGRQQYFLILLLGLIINDDFKLQI